MSILWQGQYVYPRFTYRRLNSMTTEYTARIKSFKYIQLDVFLADWPHTAADICYKPQYVNDELKSFIRYWMTLSNTTNLEVA